VICDHTAVAWELRI